MRTLAVLIFCLVAALPHGVRAAESYQVGFCTLGSWSADKNLRLDVNVWYPSVRPPRDLSYPPWEFSAARGGKAVEGRFPLLLLSHDTAGTRFSYHDTASWLASRGFVVAAPTHARDNLDHMEDLLTWSQLQTRAQELSGVIDLLLADPETASSVDADRIGVLGFGAGGAAALLLGGALPDCTAWNSYCGMAGRNDLYCNPWARTRMDKLCQSLPLTKSLADPRVRAVAAVAPGFGMLFSRAAFRWFYPPLLLVAAQNDQNNPPALHARHIYKNMEKKPRWLYLPGADAAAFAAGETVVGLVRSVEPYGVFVELAPNLAGLAEAAPGLDCGQLVSVYIKSIIPEKMKIKLVVLHAMRDETFAFPLEYRLHAGHIGRWIYSVPGAARVIETIFDG